MREIRESPKRPVNLSLNAKVVEMARDMGMNVSQEVDALLTEAVMKRYWERWNEENKDAIADYNERIAREGIPLARYRSFMKSR
jgi:antitoxin CcdA